MANDKFYGYKPKYAKGNVGVPYGEDLKFINQHPHEFRKGMDYELTSLGCSRLQESTPEEREKATESVLKNLKEHPSYYTALIQFESTQGFATKIKESSFKSYLESLKNNDMKEIKNAFKTGKMKDADFKGDKMEELKEAIKRQIRTALKEAKEKEAEDMDDDDTDKTATKGAKKGSKKLSKFDQEREALEDLIEYLKEKKDKELEKYKSSKKDKKAVEAYKKAIELSEKDKKKLEKTAEKYDVVSKDYIEKDLPSTIKALEKRKKAIDKDEEEAVAKLREEKKAIAETDMTREEQIRLLNIIKENGISLREGAQGIKTYYEIAKASYLEGLSAGLRL
tara:strand:+ start:198 stop:1211 length:1014 start_codon:yes stop_codon:yes gene_type:complete